MHYPPHKWTMDCIDGLGPFDRVVEFGSLDINGGIRSEFAGSEFVGLDLQEGPGVDVVADASTWQPDEPVDCVICLEVLEHAPVWREITENAARMLAPGGVFIMTCATDPRGEHSARLDGTIEPDDFYENVDPEAFRQVADKWFDEVVIDTSYPGDLRALCRVAVTDGTSLSYDPRPRSDWERSKRRILWGGLRHDDLNTSPGRLYLRTVSKARKELLSDPKCPNCGVRPPQPDELYCTPICQHEARARHPHSWGVIDTARTFTPERFRPTTSA